MTGAFQPSPPHSLIQVQSALLSFTTIVFLATTLYFPQAILTMLPLYSQFYYATALQRPSTIAAFWLYVVMVGFSLCHNKSVPALSNSQPL